MHPIRQHLAIVTITATYRLNGLNKPRITIDHRSGRISISSTGSYAFRESCDRIDGRNHRRFLTALLKALH